MRVVIAIEPAIAVAERLVLLQEDLADPLRLLGAEVDWTPAEQLRLVLGTTQLGTTQLGTTQLGTTQLGTTQLGEVLLGDLRDAVRRRFGAMDSFPFETLGTFFVPGPDTPRILAAGTGAGSDALRALHDEAAASFQECSVALPDRPWEPWIQIGRLRTTASTHPLDGTIRPYSDYNFGSTSAHSVLLSRVDTAGPSIRHTVVDRVALRA